MQPFSKAPKTTGGIVVSTARSDSTKNPAVEKSVQRTRQQLQDKNLINMKLEKRKTEGGAFNQHRITREQKNAEPGDIFTPTTRMKGKKKREKNSIPFFKTVIENVSSSSWRAN